MASPLNQEIRDYVEDVTGFYRRYDQGTGGWHYGFWREGVRSAPEALLAGNAALIEGLAIAPGMRVLDAGCGIGGFAVWLAKRRGCRVTGITLSPRHVEIAREIARRQGVSRLVDFAVMDMNRTEFPAAAFDAVFNHETYCYAESKPAYAREAFRLLKPGGVWRAIDFSVVDRPLTPAEAEQLEVVRSGFKIPCLHPPGEILSHLRRAGFAQSSAVDHAAEVAPSARLILRACVLPLLLRRLRLDWLRFSTDPRRRHHGQGHYLAGQAFSEGILKGHFSIVSFTGKKPYNPDG